MFIGLNVAIEVLKKYHIINDIKDSIDASYDFINDLIKLSGNFSDEFDLSLDINKYKMKKLDNSYILEDAESVLYFFHEYRNYILCNFQINALPYMIQDYREEMINRCDMGISNEEWILQDNENGLKYLETRKNMSEKVKDLLNEFDEIVNPFSKGNKDVKNLVSISCYLSEKNQKCVFSKIVDRVSIRKYSRQENGFGYIFTVQTRNLNCNISHYFNEEGEVLHVVSDSIEVKFNFSSNTFENKGSLIEHPDSFISEILLENVVGTIKKYNKNSVKVKTLK